MQPAARHTRPRAHNCNTAVRAARAPAGEVWEFVGEVETVAAEDAAELFQAGRVSMEPVYSQCGEVKPKEVQAHVQTALAILEVRLMCGVCGCGCVRSRDVYGACVWGDAGRQAGGWAGCGRWMQLACTGPGGGRSQGW